MPKVVTAPGTGLRKIKEPRPCGLDFFYRQAAQFPGRLELYTVATGRNIRRVTRQEHATGYGFPVFHPAES
jgi:hypothetical protein